MIQQTMPTQLRGTDTRLHPTAVARTLAAAAIAVLALPSQVLAMGTAAQTTAAVATSATPIGAGTGQLGSGGSDVVARISTIAPASEYYVLEATLPVPTRVVMPGQAFVPLALSIGGIELSTQVEIVSRYPSATHGADVVELIARVGRPEGTSPGDEIEFDVVRSSQSLGSFQETQPVRDLLSTPGAVRLTANDLHGNGYTADLLTRVRLNHASLIRQRAGRFAKETRTHEVMAPDSGAGTGDLAPYPHMLGAHVFCKTYANEDFVVLDVLLHNGMVHSGAMTTLDDAIDDIYLDELNLTIPDGWSLGWAIDNAMTGDPVNVPGGKRIPLIEELSTGQFHVVPQQAQFVRRLVLAHGEQALNRGLQVVRRETRGFCVPGPQPSQASTNPLDDLWSWWNEGTSRFLTSNHRLPHLDHMSRASIDAGLRSEYETYRDQVASGSEGGYPTFSEVLGWAQPWGVKYGGMTGGDEIEMIPNVAEAWSRNPMGLRFLDLRSKAYIDRQPIALFQRDGRAPRLEDHLREVGTPDAHLPFYFNLIPSGSSTYWGFKTADQRFREVAYLTGRIPYYEKDLKDFRPIDLQHYARFLNPHLGLIWLANDSISKLELELSSTAFQFSFHQYYNSSYQHTQGTGLKQRIDDITENPGQGANFGRAIAWGLVASSTYYATTTDDERNRLFPWFRLTAEIAREGQSTCTGNPSALPITKHFKGAYQSRQAFEVGFMLNAAQSLKTTVFETRAQQVANMVGDYVVGGAYSSVNPPFWNDQAGGQYHLIAVRPRWNHMDDFCNNIPNAGYLENPYFDTTSSLPSLAYAYRVTRDPLFLQRAAQSIGGSGNALMELEAWGLDTIHKTAPMLALLQSL